MDASFDSIVEILSEMYFLTSEERQLLIKSLLPQAREQTVARDLRGWSWSEPPMAPPYSVLLGASEIASRYCETGRDVWWRRVQSVKVDPNGPMIEGKLLHAVIARTISEAKRLIWTLGVERPAEIIETLRQFDAIWFERQVSKEKIQCQSWLEKAHIIWQYEASIIEARFREALSRQPNAREDSIVAAALPVIIEQRLDGSLIGLSKQLSMDAYQSAEPIILELKFGEKKSFHRLQVAGYALVAESLYEYPLNIGCIVYPSFDSGKLSIEKDFFIIDEEQRQDFLDQRDEKMRLVFEQLDPGLMTNCPNNCPFYGRCWPVSQIDGVNCQT